MKTFSIESNGRLDKTAIYINGEQVAGVKELFLNLDEEGTFDAVVAYEGTDKKIYTKSIFEDYLECLKTRDAAFTEDDAEDLRLFTVESDGDIANTTVLIEEEPQDGIVSVLVHIKSGQQANTSLLSRLRGKVTGAEPTTFKAEITYRYDDDTVQTEQIF